MLKVLVGNKGKQGTKKGSNELEDKSIGNTELEDGKDSWK